MRLQENAGRASSGRITVRHQGGGAKRMYRIIDFGQEKINMKGKVIAIEIRDVDNEKETVISIESKDAPVKEYELSVFRAPLVKVGDYVRAGDLLSEGAADLQEIFRFGGKKAAEDYIMIEVIKVYELQGVSIDKKHVEIIISQMFSRRRIIDSGDTMSHYAKKGYFIVSLFYNPRKSIVRPNIWLHEKLEKWIHFPWEAPEDGDDRLER